MGVTTGYSADGVNRSGNDLHEVANAMSRTALDTGANISRAFNGDESLRELRKTVEELAQQIHQVTEGVRRVNREAGARLNKTAKLVEDTADEATNIASALNRK
ncbi:hypothetical protein AB0O75_46760 [Streptomyces sp. NPDC088921]|uniref:hypothetical protein n=1 Tax=unclassified Streptomyces TaxID=2593676 RepID=UPI0034438FBA